jgi:hypothetical protein
MNIRHLAVVPALFLMTACGGSTPEPETPASEASTTEAKPAEEAKPADDAKPAEGGEAAPADKPADAPSDAK